jgi:hypothetical protein
VGAVVEGDIVSGTTTGTGGASTVNGNIKAGGLYFGGIGATVNGTITDMLSSNPLYVPPTVKNQNTQLWDAQ